MNKKSIFTQLLTPMIAIVSILAVVLSGCITVTVFQTFQKEVYERNMEKSGLVAANISAFMDGAFSMTQELAENPSILTMDTEIQTPILADCVARNSYLELLYIQGTDGMQTGRSSGKLADRSTRWWFIQTMEQKQSFISKSYYSVNTGMPCASIFFPMKKNNEMIGIFAVDIKLDYLQSVIEQYSDSENGQYSFVIDGEGVVVAHPDSSQIAELYNYVNHTKTVSTKDAAGNAITDEKGNIVTEEQPLSISDDFKKVITDVMAGNSGKAKVTNDGTSYYVTYASIPLAGASDSWSVITMQKVSNAMSMVTTMIVVAVVLMIASIGIAVFVIAKLAKKLTAPIFSLTGLVTAAAEGDFSSKADENIDNELGTLAVGFNMMSEKISSTLTYIQTLGEDVVHSSDKLTEIETTAGAINGAVREIKSGTDEQTSRVNEVVARASELEAMFEELKGQSKELLGGVNKSVESGNVGRVCVEDLEKQNKSTTTVMAETYEKIVKLNDQSKKISGIVATIDDISSQTSLLALNANIEAARAGEAGRGFSVVAESIGKLAQNSIDATTRINEIINELCKDIEDSVENIQNVSALVNGQSEAVGNVKKTFTDFNDLATVTSKVVQTMEQLVAEMMQINRKMVTSVEQIRDISQNTKGITDDVAKDLDEQLVAIRHVTQKVNDLSKISEK